MNPKGDETDPYFNIGMVNLEAEKDESCFGEEVMVCYKKANNLNALFPIQLTIRDKKKIYSQWKYVDS